MVPLRTFPFIASFLLLFLALGGIWISLAGATPARNPVPFADVAGSYYRGDGLGFNQTLDIKAYGSFSSRASGCLRTYDRTPGRVLRRGSLIFLGPIGPRGWDISDSAFLPVRWGDRRYLVQSGEIMTFVNEVNLGSEPRKQAQGWHYLQQDGWKLPASGSPALPDRYAQYLLDEPVEGVIYRIADDEDLTFGMAAGPATELLAPGMALVARGTEGDGTSYCQLEVVSVGRATAVVERSWKVQTDCYGLRDGALVSTSLASLPAEH